MRQQRYFDPESMEVKTRIVPETGDTVICTDADNVRNNGVQEGNEYIVGKVCNKDRISVWIDGKDSTFYAYRFEPVKTQLEFDFGD